MSRQLIDGFVAVIVFCVAVSIGSSVAWSNNIVDLAAGQAQGDGTARRHFSPANTFRSFNSYRPPAGRAS